AAPPVPYTTPCRSTVVGTIASPVCSAMTSRRRLIGSIEPVDLTTRRPDQVPRRSDGRYCSPVAREIALLINPASGGGRGARIGRAVAEYVTNGGLVVRELTGRDAEESRVLARGAVERGVDALVVVGGDGMVHLGLQAIVGSDVPFG